MPPDEDDPVVASYDVYISPHQFRSPNPADETPTGATTTDSKSAQSKIYVLQYPSHRPASKPYTSSRSQKPTSLRIKPHTGIFEVDVPLLTHDNYNEPLGAQFGRFMHDAQALHPITGHGLSGGFAQNQQQNTTHPIDLDNGHSLNDTTLRTQTLGGKVSVSTDKSPIYMLASLNRASKTIHLRHLDAVIQMRPQLHHIDAQDEAKRRAETATKAATTTTKTEVVGPDGKVKLETKAIEMKIKDSTKDDPKDRNLNWNAKLLRAIQNDPWRRYEWIERGEDTFIQELLTSGAAESHGDLRQQLQSALDNDEWLNSMSSPGIELRTRLKGRDRERARRKRQERLRAAKAAGIVRGRDHDEDGSDSIGSEDDEEPAADEGRMGTLQDLGPEVRIKQESASAIPVPTVSVTGASAAAATAVPKRRGRPPKPKGAETVTLE